MVFHFFHCCYYEKTGVHGFHGFSLFFICLVLHETGRFFPLNLPFNFNPSLFSLPVTVSLEHRLFVCAEGKALHQAVQGIGPQGSTMTPDTWYVHLRHLVDNSRPW